MQTLLEHLDPSNQLENPFDSIGISFETPGHTLLPHPVNTFFFVQSCILERFPEADTEAIEAAFEKFQYYERHHPKDFPEKMRDIIGMRPHWEAEETADKALGNVLSRFWTPKVQEEYKAWFKKKYPKEFKEAFATPSIDKTAPVRSTDLSKEKLKWMKQTPDQFLERRFPRFPYAAFYNLVRKYNFHDSGVKDYFVLMLAQGEFAKQARYGLRKVEAFFSYCKHHGICLKIYKEDPPWDTLEKKEGETWRSRKLKGHEKEGRCAIWVFTKSMGQAQFILRNWRSERPRLRKLLSTLRPGKTLDPTQDQDTPENHGETYSPQ